MKSVTVALATAGAPLLATIAKAAGLTPEDTVRVALWRFGHHLDIDVPPSAFALGGVRPARRRLAQRVSSSRPRAGKPLRAPSAPRR